MVNRLSVAAPSLTRLAVIGVLVSGTVACTEVLVPFEPECQEIEGRCWQYLGLEGIHVNAVVETPAALVVASRHGGVYALDRGSGVWVRRGLDHVEVTSLTLLPGSVPRLMATVHPIADGTTASALFASEDDGRTWVPVDGGLAEEMDGYWGAFSFAADPANPDHWILGSRYSVARSTDGGKSWQFVFASADSGGGRIWDVLFGTGGRVWAAGRTAASSSALLISEDGGETWVNLHHFNFGSFRVLLRDDSLAHGLWAGGGPGVLRSDDGGITWSTSLEASARDLIRHRGDLVVSGYNMGLHLGISSSLNGISWDEWAVPPTARGGMSLHTGTDGRLLVGTESGVWRVD